MNQSYQSSSLRRPPLPAWRLCLDLFQNLSTALTGSARLFLGAICLTTIASAGIIFNNGFEGGAADWDADGPWQVAANPVNATSETTLPAREGSKSVRFRPSTGDNRSEFTILGGQPDNPGRYDWFNSTTGLGNEYWLGMSICIITPPANGIAIMQHHSTPATVGGSVDWSHASGENSMTISVTSPTQLVVKTATDPLWVNGENHVEGSTTYIHTQTGNAAWHTLLSSAYTFQTGRWYDFVMHFKLSPENTGASAGLTQVWVTDSVTGVRTQLVNKTGTTVYRYDSGKPTSAPSWRDGLPKTQINSQKIGIYHHATTAGDVLYDSVRIWKGSGGTIEAVSPAGGGTVPNAPTSLTASSPTSSTINLSWNASAVTNETGFEIDRATNSAFTTGPAPITNTYTAGVNATGVTATGLSPSTLYYFRVRATNTVGDSTNSNTASATTSGGSPVVYDANALTIAASSGETSAAVTYTGASNGNFLRYDSNAIGDFVTFNVNVPTANIPYAISVRYQENDYRGIVQLLIDGSNQGSAFDAHSETPQLTTAALGSKTFTTAGNHTFRFQITNKNAGSQAFQMGIDTITLTP